MKAPKAGEYRSAVYTDRPPYADYEAPRKFQAIFGPSYRYRQQYNAYKAERDAEARMAARCIDGQLNIDDMLEVMRA